VLPASNYDQWGNDVIATHARKSKAEVIVTLHDLFVLSEEIWAGLDVPWIAWVPIDSFTIGDPSIGRLAHVDYPVAMSNFGAQQMLNQGVEPAAVIYHAVDTEVFEPKDKAQSRAMLGIPEDMYLVGMVMANKGNRKQFPLQLLAVKQWADSQPDLDVRVYIHTEPTNQMGGYDMRSLVKKVGLEGKVFSTNQYDTSVVPMSDESMAHVYSAFDVLMNCSMGEGFGVPIIEAQACGVPVITTGFSTMPEITHNGYTIEATHPELGLHMGWQAVPDVEQMVYRLECVYRMLGQSESMAGRAWVIQNCDARIIGAQWDELLRLIGKEHEETRKSRRMVIP
jgi:glycosyltransferase involved in cell wall biosynthesis